MSSRQPSAVSRQLVGHRSAGAALAMWHRHPAGDWSVFNVGRGGPTLRAFTLVEVLVVIVVVSLLIAVIGLVGIKVVHHQKVALTETIIKDVKMAIDRFAELDPLKSVYDRAREEPGPDLTWNTSDDLVRTFGPYPPYTLANAGSGVASIMEPSYPANLEVRLSRDLSGNPSLATPNGYVDIEWGSRNDDIRALYAYLAIYARDTLSSIPDSAKKPLADRTSPPGGPEMVNPAGDGTGSSPGPGAIDVLGIYDAWGVPLDYFLYVKLEWDGLANAGAGAWRVTQRIPVLHSWGITREEYDAEINGTDALDPELWVVSDPFPSPAAAAVNWQDGTLSGTGAAASGWTRALGAGDLRIVPGNKDKSFGYVP